VINNPALDGRNGHGGPRFVTATTRSWADRNGDRLPDCDLMNPSAQNPQTLPGNVPNPAFNPAIDSCGQWTNLNFGSVQNLLTVNPDVLEGWGIRPYDWHVGLSVQQEIVPRVSVELGYHRRRFGNFFVTDDRATTASDYDAWVYTAPSHPDLPGGGGYPLTYYNINPAAFGRIADNYYTFETDFGAARTQYWHGFDILGNARLLNGLTLQGGTSTGRGVRDLCEVARALPETLGINPLESCAVTEPWLTSFRGLATYRVPVLDVQTSAIVRFQTTATGFFVTGDTPPGSNGTSLAATHFVPNTVVAQPQHLGRLPSGGFAEGNTTVALLRPGERYPQQLRTVDMRFAKIFRFGRTRADLGIDLYNLFNTNTATGYNGTFGFAGAGWLNPTAIQNPRFLRFNLTVNY
jgi:hypothetical protein